MPYSLRLATKEDIPELIDLRIEFLIDAYGGIPDENLNPHREVLREFFNKHMESDTFIAWLAVDDKNQIIATSGLLVLFSVPTIKYPTGRDSFIFNMYTKPAWRRKGIGTKLLEKLIEESKAREIYSMDLFATDLGKPIYEKFGFKPTEQYMRLDLKK